jgi:hypothetical protein
MEEGSLMINTPLLNLSTSNYLSIDNSQMTSKNQVSFSFRKMTQSNHPQKK